MARTGTLVLVGSESLMGRELRDLAAAAGLDRHLRLIAGQEDAGVLTEHAGEAAVIEELDAASLEGARVVFLAGSTEAAQRALAAGGSGVFIDLVHATEDRQDVRLRAPMVEPEGYAVPPAIVQAIAHPAAIAIALVLERINEMHPIRRSVVHVFEPASERGRAGIEELQQQTVNLLSFKSLPKAIYDEQLGFNLLARYGEEAPFALDRAEGRLERHLATLLAMSEFRIPMPSLRLIQAPVFHGHSLSFWIEFEDNPGAAEVEAVLSVKHIDVRGAGMDPPTAAGIAGHGGIAAGAISVDPNEPDACWLWVVADNLRLAAENALEVARPFL